MTGGSTRLWLQKRAPKDILDGRRNKDCGALLLLALCNVRPARLPRKGPTMVDQPMEREFWELHRRLGEIYEADLRRDEV